MNWLAKRFLHNGETLVRVKSWRPSIGPHGVEWPTMLIDTAYGHRMTITPVWDRARLLAMTEGK